MRIHQLTSIGTLPLLAIGCAPVVIGLHNEKDIHITGECFKKDADTYAKILVACTSNELPLKIEFLGESPENVVMESTPLATKVSWKLGKNHSQPLLIKPYELQISSGERVFKATITFRTASDLTLSAVVQSFGRSH